MMVELKHSLISQRTVVPLFAILLLFSSGCASPRSWTYSPMPPTDRQALLAKTVAVPPFIDERLQENKDQVFLYLIPLMPGGWQEFNTPETVQRHLVSGIWQFKANEDVAKAISLELHNSHLFKEAFFTFRESEGDLVLRGTLISTKYDGMLITYGLSVYGPALWYLGFPAGTIKNDLALKLKLEDRASRKVLWEKAYAREHDEGTFSLYSMPSDFWYDKMLQELMPTILSDLEQTLKGMTSVQ